MQIVLTKPAEYPDFVLGPGVILDVPEHEAQPFLQAQAAVPFVRVPSDVNKVEPAPKKRTRRR